MIIVKGTFTVNGEPAAPYSHEDGVVLARRSLEKQFSGGLQGSSSVQMLSAQTTVLGSAGYVALERFTGAIGDRRGSFVCQHSGVARRGQLQLTVTVVPDSGTDELLGLVGSMTIEAVNGEHLYSFSYRFSAEGQA